MQWGIPQTRNEGATSFQSCRTWRICRIFSTLKHTDPHTVRSRPTLKDDLCNERIFRNGSFRELKVAKESYDLAKVSLESNQKSNELSVNRKCGQNDRRKFADKDKVPRYQTLGNDDKDAMLDFHQSEDNVIVIFM